MSEEPLIQIRYLFIFFLIFSLLGGSIHLSSEIVYAAGGCENAYAIAADVQASRDLQSKEAGAVRAGKAFFKYFEVMRKELKERDYLLDLIEQALIAKEGVLIMGPPGTAKSQVADMILGGIIDEDRLNEKQKEIAQATEREKETKKKKNRKGWKTLAELQEEPINSFFRLQLTPETTMSETHGPLNFKKLTEENIYDRKYEDSMLNFKNVFIDEIFDARPNALRNILGILGERAHSQGGRTRKAKLESFIAATNSYLSQVYDKAGNDGPKAVIDRFSFSSFVPGELEKAKSAIDLIRGAKVESKKEEIPRLTFQELDQIRDLVPEVDIPVHVASFLAVLSNQISKETRTAEDASLKQHAEALRNGDAAAPPYRATKYHSPRSLGKAAGILKAWVVRDWLKQQLDSKIAPEKKRPLMATLEDVKALEQFFTLNGPSDEYVKKLTARANEHEKAQLEAITKERTVFRENYENIYRPIRERYYGQVGQYVHEVHDATSVAAKKAAAHQLALHWAKEVEPHLPKTDELSELDGNAIGALMLDEVLSASGIELVGESDWEALQHSLKEKPSPPEPPVAKLEKREVFKTNTGAEYVQDPSHPLLGNAWEDPRGLTWSDRVIQNVIESRVGTTVFQEYNVMLWQDAFDACLKLNSTEARNEVKRKLAEREVKVQPLRAAMYIKPMYKRTRRDEELIREASKDFGPIQGCYLPSLEELRLETIDMGWGERDLDYKPQIFSDYKVGVWSSSDYPGRPESAFSVGGETGSDEEDEKSEDLRGVRCVCYETRQ